MRGTNTIRLCASGVAAAPAATAPAVPAPAIAVVAVVPSSLPLPNNHHSKPPNIGTPANNHTHQGKVLSSAADVAPVPSCKKAVFVWFVVSCEVFLSDVLIAVWDVAGVCAGVVSCFEVFVSDVLTAVWDLTVVCAGVASCFEVLASGVLTGVLTIVLSHLIPAFSSVAFAAEIASLPAVVLAKAKKALVP